MFVTNCLINKKEVLRPEEVGSSKGKASKKGKAAASSRPAAEALPQEVFHPVLCSVCGTEVGMQDSEEVVHFFSVLPSNP